MHTKGCFHAAKALARIDVPVLAVQFPRRRAQRWIVFGGPGEQDDFRAALDFMQARYPDVKRVWAGGMSFGSWVAHDRRRRGPARDGAHRHRLPVDQIRLFGGRRRRQADVSHSWRARRADSGEGGHGSSTRSCPSRRSSSSSTAPIICSTARCPRSATPSKIFCRISMAEALIVSAVRTPVGKAPNGSLRSTRPDELAAAVMREALNRAPG